MKWLFYHNDNDGCAAAAIRLAKDPDYELVPVDYGKDEGVEKRPKPGDEVLLVDFTLEPHGRMEALAKRAKLTWIDHHISAIRLQEEVPALKKLPGIRQVGKAGCELTWEFDRKSEEMPRAIKLIGRNDVGDFDFHADVFPFRYGLEGVEGVKDPKSEFWGKLLKGDKATIEEVLGRGRVIWPYMQGKAKGAMAAAYEVEWEGQRCLVANVSGLGPKAFASRFDPKKHDMWVEWKYDGGRGAYVFGLGTTKKLDTSKIAEKYGGGGHEQASGFLAKEMPEGLKPKGKREESLRLRMERAGVLMEGRRWGGGRLSRAQYLAGVNHTSDRGWKEGPRGVWKHNLYTVVDRLESEGEAELRWEEIRDRPLPGQAKFLNRSLGMFSSVEAAKDAAEAHERGRFGG